MGTIVIAILLILAVLMTLFTTASRIWNYFIVRNTLNKGDSALLNNDITQAFFFFKKALQRIEIFSNNLELVLKRLKKTYELKELNVDLQPFEEKLNKLKQDIIDKGGAILPNGGIDLANVSPNEITNGNSTEFFDSIEISKRSIINELPSPLFYSRSTNINETWSLSKIEKDYIVEGNAFNELNFEVISRINNLILNIDDNDLLIHDLNSFLENSNVDEFTLLNLIDEAIKKSQKKLIGKENALSKVIQSAISIRANKQQIDSYLTKIFLKIVVVKNNDEDDWSNTIFKNSLQSMLNNSTTEYLLSQLNNPLLEKDYNSTEPYQFSYFEKALLTKIDDTINHYLIGILEELLVNEAKSWRRERCIISILSQKGNNKLTELIIKFFYRTDAYEIAYKILGEIRCEESVHFLINEFKKCIVQVSSNLEMIDEYIYRINKLIVILKDIRNPLSVPLFLDFIQIVNDEKCGEYEHLISNAATQAISALEDHDISNNKNIIIDLFKHRFSDVGLVALDKIIKLMKDDEFESNLSEIIKLYKKTFYIRNEHLLPSQQSFRNKLEARFFSYKGDTLSLIKNNMRIVTGDDGDGGFHSSAFFLELLAKYGDGSELGLILDRPAKNRDLIHYVLIQAIESVQTNDLKIIAELPNQHIEESWGESRYSQWKSGEWKLQFGHIKNIAIEELIHREASLAENYSLVETDEIIATCSGSITGIDYNTLTVKDFMASWGLRNIQ